MTILTPITQDNAPPAIATLSSKEVRERAIEAANDLLAAGLNEGRAISLAIRQARGDQEPIEGLEGAALHVLPAGDGRWLITSDDREEEPLYFNLRDDALRRAHELCRERRSALYAHGADGALTERFEDHSGGDGAVFHVQPRAGGWALREEGPEGGFERFETKREALQAGREAARGGAGCLVVHYADGEEQQTVDYR